MLRAGRASRLWVSVLNRNDFFRHWYLMEGEEASTTAISRAPPHMEAIISNGVLRQFPQSNRNHWNSYPSLSSRSVFLLLALACSSALSSCLRSLMLIIISFSAAVPSWWLGSQGLISNFKTKNCPCVAVYLPGFDFQIPLSTTARLIIMPPPFKSVLFISSFDKLSVNFSLAEFHFH